jgi:hypothetical protein
LLANILEKATVFKRYYHLTIIQIYMTTKTDYKSELAIFLIFWIFIGISITILTVIISNYQNNAYNIAPTILLSASVGTIFILLLKIDDLLSVDKSDINIPILDKQPLLHSLSVVISFTVTWVFIDPLYAPSITILTIIIYPLVISFILIGYRNLFTQ